MTRVKAVIYATGWCPYCERARQLLEQKGVAFEEIDVDARPGARQEMMSRSGRGTVPQIFIGERHLGGYTELYLLDSRGGLGPLLSGASVN